MLPANTIRTECYGPCAAVWCEIAMYDLTLLSRAHGCVRLAPAARREPDDFSFATGVPRGYTLASE
jgi:hypothetical protein